MFDAFTTPMTFALEGETVVNRLGFGAMRLTGQPGNYGPYKDWQHGIALLQKAAELGVTFFDSAWAYGPEFADELVGEALEGRQVILATKGGVDKPAPGQIRVDGSPQTLRRQILKARGNLRRNVIDLFQLHRVDPKTPIEVSVEALAKAKEEGLIRHIGLSNVTQNKLERAMKVAPIASVQNRYNLADHGIAYIPYGPLRARPMQAGAHLEPQSALTWLLKRSPNIIAIPGTTSLDHLAQNMSVQEALL